MELGLRGCRERIKDCVPLMTSVLSIAPQSPHWERYSYTDVSWTGQQNLSTVKTLSDESHISIGREVYRKF